MLTTFEMIKYMSKGSFLVGFYSIGDDVGNSLTDENISMEVSSHLNLVAFFTRQIMGLVFATNLDIKYNSEVRLS